MPILLTTIRLLEIVGLELKRLRDLSKDLSSFGDEALISRPLDSLEFRCLTSQEDGLHSELLFSKMVRFSWNYFLFSMVVLCFCMSLNLLVIIGSFPEILPAGAAFILLFELKRAICCSAESFTKEPTMLSVSPSLLLSCNDGGSFLLIYYNESCSSRFSELLLLRLRFLKNYGKLLDALLTRVLSKI